MTGRPANGMYFLTLAGALAFIVHVVFSPQLPVGSPFGEFAAAPVFLWRLGLAGAVAFFLLCGLAALIRHHYDRFGLFGKAALALAFSGTAALFAHEWGQVFFLREVALVAPDALDAVEDVEQLNLFDLEAALVAASFAIGWLALAIALLRARLVPRRGPVLLIGGFFAVPLLAALLPVLWGMILGNLILACGWMILGHDLATGAGGGARG